MGWVEMVGGSWGTWLRHVFCSILKVDFFTLTFRQLERLVRGCPLPWVPMCPGNQEKFLVKRVPRLSLAMA